MMIENKETGEIPDPLGQWRHLHSPSHTGVLQDTELPSNILNSFPNKILAQLP